MIHLSPEPRVRYGGTPRAYVTPPTNLFSMSSAPTLSSIMDTCPPGSQHPHTARACFVAFPVPRPRTDRRPCCRLLPSRSASTGYSILRLRPAGSRGMFDPCPATARSIPQRPISNAAPSPPTRRRPSSRSSSGTDVAAPTKPEVFRGAPNSTEQRRFSRSSSVGRRNACASLGPTCALPRTSWHTGESPPARGYHPHEQHAHGEDRRRGNIRCRWSASLRGADGSCRRRTG